MLPVVLVTETLADQPAHWLSGQVDMRWVKYNSAEFESQLAEASGLVVRTYTLVNDQLLDQAPNLKVVGRAGVGLDNIDLQACRKRGVSVVYTPDANTQAVVEYVLGLLLDELRPRTNLTAPLPADEFHQLRKTQVGTQLNTLTLGILGFGRIGKRLGLVAWALGIKLLVCDILPEKQLRKQVNFPFEFVDHQSLYANSDIVTVHVDGRAENHHLIDENALKHFRSNTILLNAARGNLIDPVALATFAKANPKARLILDVHDPEPPTADYPLWSIGNVRLLPHLASRTDPALDNMSWVVKDVFAVLQGEKSQFPAV